MKFVLLIFSLILIVTQSFCQERSVLKLKPMEEKEVVKYLTPNATILFRKSDLVNGVQRNISDTDKLLKVNEFLKMEKKIVLDESDKKASDSEKILLQLIKEKLAVRLIIINGAAEIIRTADKKKQETIFYEIEESSSKSKQYHFLFNDGRPFFTASSQYEAMSSPVRVEAIEVVGEDVVFEEPVEIVNDDDDTRIFTIVEQSPEPIGGMTAYYEYIVKNLKYPPAAKRDKIEGTCFVSFVVQEDGNLTDLNIVKGLSPECDKEAVRLIKDGPKWKSGKQNGKARKVRFVLPVKFKPDVKK